MPRKSKRIHVLLVGLGKPPQSILLDPSEAGIASVLGEGPTESMPVVGDKNGQETFLFVAMVSRSEDLDAMERNNDPLPRMGLICGIGHRGIIALPEVHHTGFKERCLALGDKMLLSGNRRGPEAETVQSPNAPRIILFPAQN